MRASRILAAALLSSASGAALLASPARAAGPGGVEVAADPAVATRAPDGPVTEVRLAATRSARRGAARDVSAAVAPPLAAPPAAGNGVSKPVIITGGVAAGSAALVGGALLGFFAYKPGTDAEVAQARQVVCPPGGVGATGVCKTLADTLRLHEALANGGLWTLVSGGLLGMFTLVYGLSGPRAPRPPVRVQPVVTADGGAVKIGGTF